MTRWRELLKGGPKYQLRGASGFGLASIRRFAIGKDGASGPRWEASLPYEYSRTVWTTVDKAWHTGSLADEHDLHGRERTLVGRN